MSREKLLDHKLNNGWVRLERETLDGDALLHFTVDLTTHFPADVIFEQLVLGMTNSDKSWLWPSEYESTPEPITGAIREGDIFKMTYRVPRFDKSEIPAKPTTYSYTFPRYRPAERLLEYRSIDHPLDGGAVVRVIPIDLAKSRLTWIGAYRQDPTQVIVVQSILRYIPFIFEKFEENLEAHERATRSK